VSIFRFISYTLRYNVSTAAPVMMADLGLTEIQWGWVLAAFFTGYTLFQLPGGMLGDRFGPRVVLTVIAVLWSVFTAATALVPNLETASIGVIFASVFGWTFAISTAAIFALLAAGMILLVRADQQIEP